MKRPVPEDRVTAVNRELMASASLQHRGCSVLFMTGAETCREAGRTRGPARCGRALPCDPPRDTLADPRVGRVGPARPGVGGGNEA